MTKQLFLTVLFLLLTVSIDAQEAPTPASLKIGLRENIPYAIKDQEGNWSGISVELWRNVAEKEQVTYDFVEYQPDQVHADLLTAGEVDIILTSDVSKPLTDSVEFLQNHFTTTLGVASPKSTGLLSIVKGVFTMQFLWIVLSLSALLLIIGTLIYFLERKENEDQFGGDRSLLEGIGSGFWWSGVTMTTIGYGDKAPTTLGGRIVAMLWMLVAMAVSASLTASVISAVGKGNQVSFPDDLENSKVAVVEASPAADYLTKQGYSFTEFPTALAGLKALNDQEVDYVVADANTIRYTLSNNSSVAASVTTTDAAPIAFALMVKKDEALSDRLDGHLVKYLLSPAYRQLMSAYNGK